MTSLKSLLPQTVQTERLTLRLFDHSHEHYACLLDSMNTPTAHQNMGDFGIRTPEQFATLVLSSRLRPSVLTNISGHEGEPISVDTNVAYLLQIKGETVLFGGVTVEQRRAKIPPDMGWCVFEEYQGKGYAPEAAKALLEVVVKGVLGIADVIAWPGAENERSKAVARKVGFVEGPEVKDEDSGSMVRVYVLPGMKLEEGVGSIALYGDGGKDE